MKNVLVTGGARGIGAAIVNAFRAAGYNVIVNCVKSDIEGAYRADVSDLTAVNDMFDKIEREHGEIDILINNAGIAWQGLFQDMDSGAWERLFGVNVTGQINCARRAVPSMIRRGGGIIINMSSVWGQTGGSCEVGYATTKAAIIGFTRSLASELALSGIRVNCISPGVIETDMNEGFDLEGITEEIPMGRRGSPEEVAQVALFLASEGASYVTGQVIAVNGGLV